MKLDKAVREFLSSQKGVVAPATLENYDYSLRLLLAMFADREVTSISRRDLREWRAAIPDTIATSTAKTYIRVTKRFFNWIADDLADDGVPFRNPARGLASFRDEDREPKAVDETAVLAMMQQAQKDGNLRDLAIVAFLYSTGGRVGGLVALRMSDLYLADGFAMVKEKGAKTRRVFLEETAVSALRNYIQYSRPAGAGDYVFLSIRRKPLTRQGVWYALRELARRAGVSDSHVNPHAFRHAFAIAYLRNGGDLSSLRNLLGHSSIGITDEFYARWAEDQLREQHQKHNPMVALRPPKPSEKQAENSLPYKK